MCDLKATQMNEQCSLIWELTLYEFKLGINAMEETKIIYCVKGEGAVNYIIGSRCFEKFRLDCKKLNDQVKSGKPKTVDFQGHDSSNRGKLTEEYLASIRQTQHLTVQFWFITSQSQQKHPEVSKCAPCYQNIAKLLTHSGICRCFSMLSRRS